MLTKSQRNALMLSASLLLLAGCQTDSNARYGHGTSCETSVQEQLAILALAPSDIAQISLVPRRQNLLNEEVLVGVDAWVDLSACRGSLVVDMSTTCRVRQVYTRGECRLEGVKSFR
jgi:hypothetical protein